MLYDRELVRGISDNAGFNTPATTALLREKTIAEKIIIYYGLLLPNVSDPRQAYNVNNKTARAKVGVGKHGDCVEQIQDVMNGEDIPVSMVAKKEDHEDILTKYCVAMGLGIVNGNDNAVNIIPNQQGKRVVTTKNAMGLPVSQFTNNIKTDEPESTTSDDELTDDSALMGDDSKEIEGLEASENTTDTNTGSIEESQSTDGEGHTESRDPISTKTNKSTRSNRKGMNK